MNPFENEEHEGMHQEKAGIPKEGNGPSGQAKKDKNLRKNRD